jgi:hypothetical protein
MILPALDAQYVVDTMYDAIMSEQKEVYIKPIVFWLKSIGMMMPLNFRLYI